jgi:maltose alpha-D-glucosyltransferase/alpha-amylase
MPQESSLASATWRELWPDDPDRRLERALPAFLLEQRWFGGKARPIDHVRIRDAAVLPDLDAALFLVEVHHVVGEPDTYFVPLIRLPAELARARFAELPRTRLGGRGDRGSALFDATVDSRFCQWLLRMARQEGRLPLGAGSLVGRASGNLTSPGREGGRPLAVRRGSAEQSNTSIFFGKVSILKLFRRLLPGPNPDCEITGYLSEERGNAHVPALLGSLHYLPQAGEELTLGMLQSQIANQGDGWTWTLRALDRYYQACAGRSFPPAWHALLAEPLLSLGREDLPGSMLETNADYLTAITVLARRTAEIHLDLAAASRPGFRPHAMHRDETEALAERMRKRALAILAQLEQVMATLHPEDAKRAAAILACREQLAARFLGLANLDTPVKLTRVHGDYHLGQVLRSGNDFVVLDFEGEPARSLAERRSLQSPLKDVAGMIRSFSYAAQVAHGHFVESRSPALSPTREWAYLWETCVSTVFLGAYRSAVAGAHLIPERDADLERLLGAFLLDKAFYELDYELNNRPAWIRIPLLAVAGFRQSPRSERRSWRDEEAVADTLPPEMLEREGVTTAPGSHRTKGEGE